MCHYQASASNLQLLNKLNLMKSKGMQGYEIVFSETTPEADGTEKVVTHSMIGHFYFNEWVFLGRGIVVTIVK